MLNNKPGFAGFAGLVLAGLAGLVGRDLQPELKHNLGQVTFSLYLFLCKTMISAHVQQKYKRNNNKSSK